MNIVAAIGSLSLGVVVGWLVRYFIRRFKNFTPQALSFVISIAAGGAAIKFLEADKTVWWFYPIGLLLGFVVYTIVAIWAMGKKGADAVAYAAPLFSPENGDDKGKSAVVGGFRDNGTFYAPPAVDDPNIKVDLK